MRRTIATAAVLLSVLLSVLVCVNSAVAEILLRQSTATTVRIGPFVDEVDGVTAQTGLGGDGGNIETNVRLSKNGGAFAARSSTTDPAHDTAGWYSLHLDATDTNTLGSLIVAVNDATSYVPVWHEFRVVSAETYARLVGGREYDGAGRVWFVSSTGSDSNAGTRDAPLATFAQAVSSAASGDTIRILSGTFASASDVNTTKRLRVIGNGITNTTLEFSGGGGFTPGAASEIIGCRLVNTLAVDAAAALTVTNNHVSIRACTVDGGGGYALKVRFARGVECVSSHITSTNHHGTILVYDDAASDSLLATMTLRDCTVAGVRQTVYMDDRCFLAAERCHFIARYTGTDGGHCAPLVVDIHDQPGGYVSLRDCILTSQATNAAFAGRVAAITSWADGVDSGVVTGEVRGGRVFVSNAGTGATLHFDARNSPSALRVYGCSHDATKNNGYVQVVDSDVADALANTETISGEVAGVGAKVNTLHDDRLTAARAANLDLLDDIDTRTGGMNTKVNTLHDDRLTAARAANLDLLDAPVSSIQADSDTRDLEPVQFTWNMSRRADGTMRSTNTLVIAPGETVRVGFECAGTIALPPGAVLASMTEPTPASGEVVATKLGIDAHVAKVQITADESTSGGEYWVRASVTNNLGGGPVVLLGRVKVAVEP